MAHAYSQVDTSSVDEFVDVAVKRMQELIHAAIEKKGSCLLGLSGGSTPKPIYTKLGEMSGNEEKPIDWSKVHVFLVDDRYIPVDDKRSNQFLLSSTLLQGNARSVLLHLPDTSLPLAECISSYAAELKTLFNTYGNEQKSADVLTLGLGPDGHLASLFPSLDASLHLGAGSALVVNTQTERFDVKERLSINLDSIVGASARIFFLNGASKQETWKEMTEALSKAETAESVQTRWPAGVTLSSSSTYVLTCGWTAASL